MNFIFCGWKQLPKTSHHPDHASNDVQSPHHASQKIIVDTVSSHHAKLVLHVPGFFRHVVIYQTRDDRMKARTLENAEQHDLFHELLTLWWNQDQKRDDILGSSSVWAHAMESIIVHNHKDKHNKSDHRFTHNEISWTPLARSVIWGEIRKIRENWMFRNVEGATAFIQPPPIFVSSDKKHSSETEKI